MTDEFSNESFQSFRWKTHTINQYFTWLNAPVESWTHFKYIDQSTATHPYQGSSKVSMFHTLLPFKLAQLLNSKKILDLLKHQDQAAVSAVNTGQRCYSKQESVDQYSLYASVLQYKWGAHKHLEVWSIISKANLSVIFFSQTPRSSQC